MARRARARSTCAAGALGERLRRVNSWRSSAVSGRRGSFRWRDMGHLGARGSLHHHTSSHSKRPTRACLQRVAAWGGRAHVGAMRRLDVTDEQWRRLEPLLPPEKPRTGRPNHDHRRVVSGMLWIHRTGAPWRDLPERYGPVGTVSSRFYRWCRAGVWDRILSALQAEADARGEIDWDLHFVDATIVRAHQHAAGARRTGAVGGCGAR